MNILPGDADGQEQNEGDPSESSDEAFVRSNESYEDPVVWKSSELFLGRREVWINHEGILYRLRTTASKGLYLTK